MKKILSLVASLTVISGVCAAVLAYVNDLTREPIAQMLVKKTVEAARAVLPPETAEVEKAAFADGEEYFIGKDASGAVAGYAVKGSDPGGYGGDVVLMVGFKADRRTVVCYKTLAAAETPGLGMKLNTPEFSGQFAGRDGSSLRVRKDGGEIEAITSATITSRAVCGAIAKASAKLR
ncbi:MAG: RnfABCDGE type electron transport complex subunit G [Kiritimatiellae bacterium]|nr:RnfABCDGE type electron transport complex subunit G [Kiritimatiellia bacterium]